MEWRIRSQQRHLKNKNDLLMRFDYLYSIKSLVRLQRIIDCPLFHQGAVNTVMFKCVFVEMLIISFDIYAKKNVSRLKYITKSFTIDKICRTYQTINARLNQFTKRKYIFCLRKICVHLVNMLVMISSIAS